MLDVFGLPTQSVNYQEFLGGANFRDWVKPRGVSMVRVLMIGGGGGGASGAVGGTSGCTGGGSGGILSWIGPAMFVPDIIRVRTGQGGAGGVASTTTAVNAGSDAGNAQLLYQLKDGTGYTLALVGGGGGGGIAGGGAAGAAATVTPFLASGIWQTAQGMAGADKDTAITLSTTLFVTGGAGGSSTTTGSGKDVPMVYEYPTIPGGVGNGVSGGNGYFLTRPLFVGSGGAGGAGHAVTAGVGGNGGNGGIGCGGGGGGRGGPSGTSGRGGRGGDGAVFIWAW